MKYLLYLILPLIIVSASSCVDQERLLYDRYINLSEPNYHGDTVRMYKILKIHKKLYKKHPDNLIYFGNVFQSNCSLGKYEDNVELIKESILPDDPDINSRVYRNFYLALNEYRHDRNSNYNKYLEKLLEENLDHNPLLGYIAARCTNQEKMADHYYPLMQDYIFAMPEKNIIERMIESDKCDRFLELYRGICPVCEICYNRYPI
ncbi:hypothetical protein N9B82_00650 [Saprospiraceae bacterium]|nr:hypothetical protein [Saprospiraceae bacterium]